MNLLPRLVSTAFVLCSLAACASSAHAPSAPPGSERAPGFVTGVSNPEDLVQLPGTPWIVISAMRSRDQPGALLVVDSRAPDAARPLFPAGSELSGAPAASVFAPHGIDVRALGHGAFELLVVDHGGGEAIDRFWIGVSEGGAPSIQRVSRIALPPGTSANGVVAMPDGGFAISSMFDPRDSEFVEKFDAAEPTGGLWRWSTRGEWHALPSPPMSGANGIALSPDGSTLFAAEWAARRIWRVPLDGGPPQSVMVSFLPDNLRWTDDHKLLVAGQHAKPKELFTCSAKPSTCPLGFVVATVDPKTLAVETLLDRDAAASVERGFGGGTGALQVGSSIWVGSFLGDRLERFPLRSRPRGREAPSVQVPVPPLS